MNRTIFGAAALALVASLSMSACGQMNIEEHTFTVESKDRECTGNGDGGTVCYYVVFGTDGEVFTNRDDLFHNKFDSATMQAKFRVGDTYTVKTTGWRVPFASMKPNIFEIVSHTPAEKDS